MPTRDEEMDWRANKNILDYGQRGIRQCIIAHKRAVETDKGRGRGLPPMAATHFRG